MGISIVLAVLFYFGGNIPNTEEPRVTNIILNWGYILIIIAGILALAFPVIYAIMRPQNLKRIGMIVVFAAVIVVIAYLLASDEVLKIPAYSGTDNVPSVLKKVGTGLISMYILLGLAVLTIVYTEISKYFK